MRVLHSIESLSVSSGGPSRTVTALCDALAEAGLDITLCSQVMPGESPVPAGANLRVARHLVAAYTGIWRRFGLPLSRLVGQFATQEKPAIIHDHGLWTPQHHYIVRLCRERGIPLVLHPRGMLEPWALGFHAWRKKIAWQLYTHGNLRHVALFMATAEQEVKSIRRLGFRQPIACIANGVFLPEATEMERLRASLPPSSSRTALFMGRIHPIKGVFTLLEAWHRTRPAGWRLVLAGPDEAGHARQVLENIAALDLADDISLVGEVEGERKSQLFAQASLFILPSFSENFGVAVAEALAYGLPVITTTGTPWRELPECGCGWWVAPEVDALTEALREACAMPTERLAQMGERGRAVAARYDWQNIAQQTAAAYHWLLHGGARPDWVHID